MNSTAVRVRFAPSPTGFLHVGGARTALFNWLFARHHGGTFVLRIEDTDEARFREEYLAGIFTALRWLGLNWDEGPERGGDFGPYAQRQRLGLYSEVAGELWRRGALYECFCAPASARVATERSAGDDGEGDDEAMDAGCRCASLSDAARAQARGASGDISPALRFLVDPARAFVVADIVRGTVTFPPGTVGDFVIVKSGGDPLYNFAAAVDDNAMNISHVIRGEEHLANTPKQLLIYEAMGWQPPAFAHIPIILNEQRRKLSKRDGATFVNDYQTLGYLPEALVNFLALLGWSPGDNREILTKEEMVREFRIEDVVKHPAIFDLNKLSWMNKEYLGRLPVPALAEKVSVELSRRFPQSHFSREYVEQVSKLLQPRVKTVAEVVDHGSYFFADGPITPAADAVAKYLSTPEALQRLREAREALAQAPDFSLASVEAAIRGLAEQRKTKAAEFIHPLRVAVTGQAVSPGIFEVCHILGRDKVLQRIDALLAAEGVASQGVQEPSLRAQAP